jgi:hypothetical protein
VVDGCQDRRGNRPPFHRTERKLLGWSVGHQRRTRTPVEMASPGPSLPRRRVGALTRSAPCLICALG